MLNYPERCMEEYSDELDRILKVRERGGEISSAAADSLHLELVDLFQQRLGIILSDLPATNICDANAGATPTRQ